ncbi:MAG TPA: hypothetical protein VF723_16945 [Pyrinomonadaceae bacterium]
MKIRTGRLVAAAVLVACSFSGAAVAQNRLNHLRSWAGRYPTHRTGRLTRNFFQLPEIRQPLLKLLSRVDFNLLTRAYQVETPVKRLGDYLAVKVCRPHLCDTDNAGFAINLRDGSIYVRMSGTNEPRWFNSGGQYTALPQRVLDFLNEFSAT